MQTSLVIVEDKRIHRLRESILRKKQTLAAWMEKVTTLQIELDGIKNEYSVRIGYLILKDNQLDLEIIQYRNLKKLMDEGMTYEEAVKTEEDKFYNEILRMQKEQEKLEEEKSFFERQQEIPEDIKEESKILWKKLIRKFHPDLVADIAEKHRREKIMQQINNAYAQADIDALKEIDATCEINEASKITTEMLEKTLINIEQSIQKAKSSFTDLRQSEWYVWKKKKEKAKNRDIFGELEAKLLDDVVKKIAIVQKLRSIVHPGQN